MARQIIIDTDPGQDDAIALLLAMSAPEELEILGIVVVAGNAELDDTLNNAQRVVELADPSDERALRIFRGSGAPIARKLVTCQGFHGDNGLAGIELPPPKRAIENQSGVEFLVEILEGSPPRSVTVCTLGPMTNLAKAVRTKPQICAAISELVMMGGAFLPHGNISPAAEFNMHVDPEAAALSLTTLTDWGVPIAMMPLDVTHKAAASQLQIDRFRSLGNCCGGLAADVLEAWGSKPHYEPIGGVPLHDPCVIAYLLAPELFSGRRVNVEVETRGQWTSGMTVVDWWGESGRAANVTFMTDIDAAGYFDLLYDRLSCLP